MPEQAKDQVQPPEKSEAEMAVEHIDRLLNAPTLNENDDLPEALSRIARLEDVHKLIWGIRKMVRSLSSGNLDYICKERGFIAGSLKAFQSNLRHLTWQAGRIASGEYNHRVNFMGEFSVAFNKMIEQLDKTINSLTSLSEQYKDLSYHDPLTGYYNRAGFMKHALNVLESGGGRHSSMIMADIDHFKQINDNYGHLCGDEVLKAFSGRLKSLLRSQELCCRYGGEEFIIFMPTTPIETGMPIANRLRAAVEAMNINFEGQSLKITASFGVIGVEEVPEGVGTEDFLISCIGLVDANLYEAKNNGRTCVIGPAVMPQRYSPLPSATKGDEPADQAALPMK